jgi:hypothetical protein
VGALCPLGWNALGLKCTNLRGLENPTDVFVKLTHHQKSKSNDSIAFAIAANFLSAFSAQKTHVKPPNHLTL